jgi:hypothetical protein
MSERFPLFGLLLTVTFSGAIGCFDSEYLVTGMTTFIVNNDGIVYQLYNRGPGLASHR